MDLFRQKFWKYARIWWLSLLLLPFMYYTLHQVYWSLRYNIFFAVSYNFPFPLNIIYFLSDNVVLLIHEAGHTILDIFGVRLITALGGTLFQVFIPALMVFFFMKKEMKAAIQLSLTFLGFSFLDTAMYAADGGQQQLPLIGGISSEYHDWLYILSTLDILDKDYIVGILFSIFGIICYVMALFLPVIIKNYEDAKLNIKF